MITINNLKYLKVQYGLMISTHGHPVSSLVESILDEDVKFVASEEVEADFDSSLNSAYALSVPDVSIYI